MPDFPPAIRESLWSDVLRLLPADPAESAS